MSNSVFCPCVKGEYCPIHSKQDELLLKEIADIITSGIATPSDPERYVSSEDMAKEILAKAKQHIKADLEPLMAEALDISDWSFVQEYIRNLSEV